METLTRIAEALLQPEVDWHFRGVQLLVDEEDYPSISTSSSSTSSHESQSDDEDEEVSMTEDDDDDDDDDYEEEEEEGKENGPSDPYDGGHNIHNIHSNKYWMEPGWTPTDAAGNTIPPDTIRRQLMQYLQASHLTKTAFLQKLGVNANSYNKFCRPDDYVRDYNKIAMRNATYLRGARFVRTV